MQQWKLKIRLSSILFWAAILIFVGNVLGILLTVILNSFSTEWYAQLLPKSYTLEWYAYIAREISIGPILRNTFVVALTVVFVAIVISFPAAYVLSRHEFRGKSLLMTLFLLPMIVPPMTYGIPLAIMMYATHLAGRLVGVILCNLVPIVPFVILILMPFIEQVGVNLESAAKMLGARRLTIFLKVLIPLTLPGILTAGILAIVRTIAMFELTYLVAGGARSQTIVVSLYAAANAPGARPPQGIDGIAFIYFLITMILMAIALRFVSPTQMVFKIK
jgi:putative spermidine/putrescine transport system permease protein